MKKRVLELQLEDGGAVFDLNYLPALLREVEGLLEVKEDIQRLGNSRIDSILESLEHLTEVMTKSDGSE